MEKPQQGPTGLAMGSRLPFRLTLDVTPLCIRSAGVSHPRTRSHRPITALGSAPNAWDSAAGSRTWSTWTGEELQCDVARICARFSWTSYSSFPRPWRHRDVTRRCCGRAAPGKFPPVGQEFAGWLCNEPIGWVSGLQRGSHWELDIEATKHTLLFWKDLDWP